MAYQRNKDIYFIQKEKQQMTKEQTVPIKMVNKTKNNITKPPNQTTDLLNKGTWRHI